MSTEIKSNSGVSFIRPFKGGIEIFCYQNGAEFLFYQENGREPISAISLPEGLILEEEELQEIFGERANTFFMNEIKTNTDDLM